MVGRKVGQTVQDGPPRGADIGQPHSGKAPGRGATVVGYCIGKNHEPSTGVGTGNFRRMRSRAAQTDVVGPRMKAGGIAPRFLPPEVEK